jgi:CubicO group peptidase (beta-lactamase class C family)
MPSMKSLVLWSLSLTALIVFAPAALVRAQHTADARKQVDEIFKAVTQSTPGCAVGADVKGEPVVRAAYGMADLEHDVPFTVDTISSPGSVGKQFTAAAVLLLARDGKLSLDDPARKYLPELPPSAAEVTIRQMLNHTAGLRDWGYLTAMAGIPRDRYGTTLDTVLDILSRQRALDFTPGTRWSYSNSGYTLAAILVSRVSGMPFPEFTKRRIFDPLGMTSTSFPGEWTQIIKRRADGYTRRGDGFARQMSIENVYGNGGLFTTVDDLLKWNRNFDRPVVGDAAFVEALQERARFTDGGTHEYALGLYVDTYQGVREVDHSGGGLGYAGHFARYPDQQVSVAVMCNLDAANVTAMAKSVARLFLTGLHVPPPPSSAHTLTDDEASRLTGLYRSKEPVGSLTVVFAKGRLLVPNVAVLIPRSATRFVTSDSMTYEFQGRDGLQTTDEFGRVIVYDRVEPAQPTPAMLREFEGHYVSDEVDTRLELLVEDGVLTIRRPPEWNIRLTPVYADAFRGDLGWVTFERDDTGQVTRLNVSQERLWRLPFDRR